MFQFFFRYPAAVFTRGHLVLLGSAPRYLLLLAIVASVGTLAFLVRLRMSAASPRLRGFRAWALWGMQSLFVTLLLLLLWQPAVRVAELNSEQNIIAVLVDDSRSMSTPDGAPGGVSREGAALAALNDTVLPGLRQRFQTRVYHLDGGLVRGLRLQIVVQL